MTDAVCHRGPDDSGLWIDEAARVGLGHRRLAIIDLSPSGHQPMISTDGRWVLCFNGEIYNHAEMRTKLEQNGHCQAPRETGWRGRSDTETLVEYIATYGLEAALTASVGMFAFALWDKAHRKLFLARDRFGEKPLYYGWSGDNFMFGSELKSLRSHPAFDNIIDRSALRLFTARGYVPAPRSIFEGIFKLEPGCFLTLTPDRGLTPRKKPPQIGADESGIKLSRYWSYRQVVENGFRNPILDEVEAIERLEAALATAICGQAVADVPVGAFLSGGIDSSAIVALYQKHTSGRVRTFTIGFEEAGYNEADDAKAVAAHFGTEHHERYVSVREAQAVIPLLPEMYDEPFGDSSQIPTHLVSRFAREQVTVALSGDAGDELFAGYNRHFSAPRLWQRLQMLPHPLRAMLGRPLSQVPAGAWGNAARLLNKRAQPHVGTKIQRGLAIAVHARSFDDIYNSFLDEWSGGPNPVRGLTDESVSLEFDLDLTPGAPDTVRAMYSDATSYLPDDILCKVDRAAMAVSLETRVPFLDHHVAELAARVPLSMKVRNGRGKHILREILYREAPRALFDRPKAGFAVPIGNWLRGPLQEWAEDLLDQDRLKREGYFNAAVVRGRWQQHLSGQTDATQAIWPILMFQAWLAATKREAIT